MKWIGFLLFNFIFYNVYAFNLIETRKAFYTKASHKIENAELLRSYFLDEAPDSIFNLGNHLIVQGIKKENTAWINYGKLLISSYYNKKGKTTFSEVYLKDCIFYYERIKNKQKLADCYNLLGEMYYYESKFKEAVPIFLKSLHFANELPDEEEAFMAYVPLAETYIVLEKYDLAEKNIRIFLKKVEKLKLNKALRKAHGILAKIYLHRDQKEKAIVHFNKALNFAYLNGDKLGLSTAYNNIGIAFFELGELDKTKYYFEKALQMRLEINLPTTICESYYNLAELASFNNNNNLAIEYLNKLLPIANEANLFTEEVDAYQKLIDIYQNQKNNEKAFLYANLLINAQKKQLKSSNEVESFLEENQKVLSLEEQKLTQKKREEVLISRINNEKQKFTYLVIFVSLFTVTLFLFFVFKKNKIN